MNSTAMAACLWAMDEELHEEHVAIIADYHPEYAYNAILWLKLVWEVEREHPWYLQVLQGTAHLEALRKEIAAKQEKLNRLVAAYKHW